MDNVSDALPEAEKISERLNDIKYELEDIAEGMSALYDFGGDDPAVKLDRAEARLHTISRLKKKYGSTVEEILDFRAEAVARLSDIENADSRAEELADELSTLEEKANALSKELSERRRRTSRELTKKITETLTFLDMPKVQFACQFTQLELTAIGADAVAFYMSANVGEALKPMSKVASGGELARIMLAMKNVLAEQDKVNTLIFDEVDTGVSGRAAQKVAEKLKSVARNKQVLCVTHLPQLAAMGDTHLLIAKGERDGRTYTTVTPLDLEGRKRELARIIGGANITETTLKSAEEMLRP